MSAFLESLAARRRFGMKPGLETMQEICRRLGSPEKAFHPIHVAGTNGKGAVCAILDACLDGGRYTSPHLVKINERFFLHGHPLSDVALERAAARVAEVAPAETTFFEALTAVAFLIYAEAQPTPVVLETGLGGRLDATNVCEPKLCVITRIGLDHCDWLGDTVDKIAAEKAGIVKPGVPVVLGANPPEVRAVVEARAKAVGAPFFFAPEMVNEHEIPEGFSLPGAFNRENAVTAIAALRVLQPQGIPPIQGFSRVIWPGRFQKVRNFIIDGAHNPPAARALAKALDEIAPEARSVTLIAGFCGDKDVDQVLTTLAPRFRRGFAVQTNNPRSLAAAETAAKGTAAGIPMIACPSLAEALNRAGSEPTVICGSLFLAGEALVALDAYPWGETRFDPSELLRT